MSTRIEEVKKRGKTGSWSIKEGWCEGGRKGLKEDGEGLQSCSWWLDREKQQ